jgi:hypothetical protein
VDLEVQVAADRASVAGHADGSDPLARIDPLAAVDEGWVRHVGVEVGAALAFAVDQQVVAVENRVVAGAQHATAANGDQRGTACRDDVEALVGAAATARSPELADVAAGDVRTLDREDVVVVAEAAVG